MNHHAQLCGSSVRRFVGSSAKVLQALLLLALLSSGALHAGELYRLRTVVPPTASLDGPLTVQVLLDATGYPDLESPVATVDGFTFSLQLPAGSQVSSWAWGEQVDSAIDATVTTDGGVFRCAGVLKRSLPNGIDIEIMSMVVTLDESQPSSSASMIEFGDEAPVLLTSQGGVLPHLLESSASLGAANPSADSQEWPEPTSEQQTAQWSEGSEGGGGSGAPEGGPSYENSAQYCTWEAKGPLPPKAGDCQNPQQGEYCYFNVNTLVALQNTIDLAIPSIVPTVIVVAPGTYFGGLNIDLSGLVSHVIVVSELGPEQTTINGGGFTTPVFIHGNPIPPIPAPSGTRFTFGWHQADDLDPSSPFDGGTTSAFDRGWQGFELTNGSGVNGAGVLISQTVPDAELIEIRGNYIHSNFATQRGGGIHVELSTDVDIISNDISNNSANFQGGGVCIWEDPNDRNDPKATIGKNYIYENFAGTQGGGVYAGYYDSDICLNFIYENQADQGGGVLLEFIPDSGGDHILYAEANEVSFNFPNTDSPAAQFGGGIAVIEEQPVMAENGKQLGLVRNKVYRNGENLAGQFSVDSGGGIYIDVVFGDGPGPFGVLLEGPAGQIVVGNGVYLNRAAEEGGGVWLGTQTLGTPSPIPLKFWTQTLWQNIVETGTRGYGLYVALNPNSDPIDASSTILHNHIELGGLPESDWWVELNAALTSLDFSFTPLCPTSPQDILSGAASTSSVLPVLQSGADLRIYVRQLPTSASVDAGEAGLVDPLHPRLGFDLDLESRVLGVRMDSGADELQDSREFVRGDANDDGTL